MITEPAHNFLVRVVQSEGFPELNIIKDINIENRLGENALHYAVFWKEIEAAKSLVKSGININKQGENGYTPLHEAVEQEYEEMTVFLVQSGADLSIKNDLNETPVEMARSYDLNHIKTLINQHNQKNTVSIKKPHS
ncbi:MAG TPA: ankyrin repeat domain-containing protein [Gammaproteobacteria bacterium]|nr:ankyrin repeat domain-containing protein [Gammaproteobacteria bacterium]